MLMNEMKMPVQKRSKARLELVLKTTIELLEKQGIDKCTIPEIAKIADLPKINIYQYFPTVNHLFTILIKRYLEELQTYVVFNAEHYKTWETLSIAQDLMVKVADFYNMHKAASILILGGPVHVEGFNLQEMVIEQISKNLYQLFTQKHNPMHFEQPEVITYLVEMTFSLMKHSFYKFGVIRPDIVNECILITELYVKHKAQY